MLDAIYAILDGLLWYHSISNLLKIIFIYLYYFILLEMDFFPLLLWDNPFCVNSLQVISTSKIILTSCSNIESV